MLTSHGIKRQMICKLFQLSFAVLFVEELHYSKQYVY